MRVLYEDNHLLGVYKPPGVPAQADESGAADLLSQARAYIKQKYGKPGEAYLGLVHRLDRPVGGVMLFARTSKAAARLSAQFGDRSAGKVYLAVAEGEAALSATLKDFIKKDERTRNVSVVPEGTPGALFAELDYERLDAAGGLSLLRVTLKTGRPHQIRVQLASRGLPIYADARYGKARPNADIALHAAALTVLHPTLRTPITISAFPPDSAPWSLFGEAIQREMGQFVGQTAP